MDTADLLHRFSTLSTANLTDGCVRAQVPVRCAPTAMHAIVAGDRVVGRALPARHVGSVDIFLEALEGGDVGDVLVVDNGGRLDESCVGDLMALEAQNAGLAGIVIWGLSRDTVDIKAIGLPIFSLGTLSTGPLSVGARPDNALRSATVGEWTVTRNDLVVGDEDGVIFLPTDRAEEVFALAETIRDTERHQADRIRSGDSLRSQVRFDRYLADREKTPSLTFREHLRAVGGEIEV